MRIDGEIFQRFPGYAAFVIYARDLDSPSGEAATASLREAEAARREGAAELIRSHPHLQAWREAYRQFGAKPKAHVCSVEALLRRIAVGESLPSIHPLVDLYNAVSLRHLLPIGGENQDALQGDLVLGFATGQEAFETSERGLPVTVRPSPGEVVWSDDGGVTCRRWNWRQGTRTRLGSGTRRAFFVLDRLPPFSLEDLRDAGGDLLQRLRTNFPGATFTYEVRQS
jgi:DNA/RNA-binding domain of Phe-tRNA-synthetase-like protein